MKKIQKKEIRKELIRVNQLENIKREFTRVIKTDFSNFKSNLETKVSIIKEIEKIIRKKGKKVSILEIGAGYGDLSITCMRLLKKIKKYVVTELNKEKVEIIKRNLGFDKNIEVRKLDIIHLKDFHLMCDIIIFSEILEHLTEIEKEVAFINLNKFLKDGGYLIISCPITEYIGRRLFYSTKEKSKLEYKTIRGHIGVPSVTKIISLFYRKGFNNVKIKPLPIILPFRKKIIEPLIAMIEFFLRILPKWFRVYISAGVIAVGKKVSSLDDSWYNDVQYLLKYLPSKEISEGKLHESFFDYKHINKKGK